MPRITAAATPAASPVKTDAFTTAERKKLSQQIAAQAGDGKRFPDLTGGNCGVHGYEVGARQGQLLLDLAGDGVKLNPAKQTVIALLETGDEPTARLLIVDKQTLAMREAGDIDFFNRPLTGQDGTELDAFHGYHLLLKGAPELPLPHENKDWNIGAFKSDDGPARLPKLDIPKPRAKQPQLWLDTAGQKYVAGKMKEHAGTKLPALDGGKRGTHFFEVTGEKASKLLDIAGGFYSAKNEVLVAILQTGKPPTLMPLSLNREQIGKPRIENTRYDALTLEPNVLADLLAGAREIPVPGRVEGFQVTELLDTRRADAANLIGSPRTPAQVATSTDRRNSALSTRLQAMTGRSDG